MWSRENEGRHAPAALLIGSLLALVYVAALVSAHAIEPALARPLLPRWDLAAHLVNGWTDYYYLTTGRIHRLLWDLWGQAYWPPGQSLFQIPFYLAFGGSLSAGLHSSVAAFVLAGVAWVILLGHAWGRAAWLPAAIALLFSATSPFLLAYASVAMSEMVGVLAQAWVLVCHSRYEQTRRPGAARWFAVSLTALFFTKYNYFVLLAVPLACHVRLFGTGALSAVERLRRSWRVVRSCVSTATGGLVAAYLVVVAAVVLTDGFAFSLGGHRVAFRTIGYSAHPVLYALLARVWWLHRRGRIDWARLFAIDPRIRPLLLWFVVPVTVWLASPYPNHIKDVANLVVNIPMGEPTARLGLLAYLSTVRADYFLHPLLLAVAATGFAVAAVRYRAQPPLVRLLLVTAVLQFVMITAHQTRDPRFVLLAMPWFWLVSAGEVGRWLARSHRWAAALAAALVAVAALAGARAAVRGEAFRRIAFDNYVDSPALVEAFAAIRAVTGAGDRVAVLGRRDAVSPGLVRWQLGPPSGEAAFPHEVLRAADVDLLDTADFVVLVAPAAPSPASGAVADDEARDAARVQAQVEKGRMAPVREFAVDDLHVVLRLFRRRPPGA